MSNPGARWLDTILLENAKFRERIQPDQLPTQRTPGPLAVITCMDPRINLEALGIPQFTSDGQSSSDVRVIRTGGAIAEPRSLFIGLFQAGIRELAIVAHTDCGFCLAYSQIDALVEKTRTSLTRAQWDAFQTGVGEPFLENLRTWLGVFQDPYAQVKHQVAHLKMLAFMPHDIVIHGLVYELESGTMHVVVNGYAETQ